jgi:hypothetical protein
MTNKYIAEVIAPFVVNPQTQARGVALQKFVEKVVLPAKVDTYTEAQMSQYIKDYLDGQDAPKELALQEPEESK